MFFSRKVLKFERCGDGKLLVFSNPASPPPPPPRTCPRTVIFFLNDFFLLHLNCYLLLSFTPIQVLPGPDQTGPPKVAPGEVLWWNIHITVITRRAEGQKKEEGERLRELGYTIAGNLRFLDTYLQDLIPNWPSCWGRSEERCCSSPRPQPSGHLPLEMETHQALRPLLYEHVYSGFCALYTRDVHRN